MNDRRYWQLTAKPTMTDASCGPHCNGNVALDVLMPSGTKTSTDDFVTIYHCLECGRSLVTGKKLGLAKFKDAQGRLHGLRVTTMRVKAEVA